MHPYLLDPPNYRISSTTSPPPHFHPFCELAEANLSRRTKPLEPLPHFPFSRSAGIYNTIRALILFIAYIKQVISVPPPSRAGWAALGPTLRYIAFMVIGIIDRVAAQRGGALFGR